MGTSTPKRPPPPRENPFTHTRAHTQSIKINVHRHIYFDVAVVFARTTRLTLNANILHTKRISVRKYAHLFRSSPPSLPTWTELRIVCIVPVKVFMLCVCFFFLVVVTLIIFPKIKYPHIYNAAQDNTPSYSLCASVRHTHTPLCPFAILAHSRAKTKHTHTHAKTENDHRTKMFVRVHLL